MQVRDLPGSALLWLFYPQITQIGGISVTVDRKLQSGCHDLLAIGGNAFIPTLACYADKQNPVTKTMGL
jgi:hypothetical protein